MYILEGLLTELYQHVLTSTDRSVPGPGPPTAAGEVNISQLWVLIHHITWVTHHRTHIPRPCADTGDCCVVDVQAPVHT